jgi:beta-RFAP synthase
LHFGLYGFGHVHARQFGGVGAMIDQPRTRLRVTPARTLLLRGPQRERIAEFVSRWQAFHRIEDTPGCVLELIESPPAHAGLGSGTQLGLAVAAALNQFVGLPMGSPLELALSVGRGLRSAVGTYGFMQGGLIVERGKLTSDPLSPLDLRASIPDDWRFVLVTPTQVESISGSAEIQAFASLEPVAEATAQRLIALVREEMVPQLMAGDCPAFGETLYAYCRQAGLAFARVQGGPYNGPVLTELIDTFRRWGIHGVGQSSWGPTLFCLFSELGAAESFVQRVQSLPAAAALKVAIVAPRNTGASLVVEHAET